MELRYKQIGDYLYPDLKMPEQTTYEIGKYGRLRLDFMLKHRRGTYTTILTEGRLNEYLHEIDEQAAELMETTMARLADEQCSDATHMGIMSDGDCTSKIVNLIAGG